jgi:hypothetical protein
MEFLSRIPQYNPKSKEKNNEMFIYVSLKRGTRFSIIFFEYCNNIILLSTVNGLVYKKNVILL